MIKTKKMKKIILLSLINLLTISCKKDDSSANTLDSIKKITFGEAQTFMQNRFTNINQKLMRSKEVNFNGVKLYMFMSVPENGLVCISSVSENALEVFASDCGTAEMKVSEWNALH
jgi:hypothetical protein